MASGGAREGAGRKKTTKSYSDKFKENIWKALESKAKEKGTTVFDQLAEKLLDPRTKPIAFASLWKTLCDVMAEKQTKAVVEKHDFGPSIGLPPIKEKPKEESFWTQTPTTTRPN